MPERPIAHAQFVRARREMRVYVTVLFLLVMLFVTWTLWQNEHDSCMRARATRETQVDIIAVLHLHVKHPPVPLSCDTLLPGH